MKQVGYYKHRPTVLVELPTTSFRFGRTFTNTILTLNIHHFRLGVVVKDTVNSAGGQAPGPSNWTQGCELAHFRRIQKNIFSELEQNCSSSLEKYLSC